MKYIILNILTLLSFLCLGQKKTECFYTFSEYKGDNPSFEINETFQNRTSGDKILMGGIDNFIFKNVESKDIRKKLKKH